MDDDRQRIDKWLWHARVVRTRSAAAALAASGHVRLNGSRIEAASRAVKVGDVVTVALDGGVRVLRVAGFSLRRGSAPTARNLFEDLTLPAKSSANLPTGSPDGSPAAAARESGAGRPTKRDRRAIDHFTIGDDT